MQPDIEFGRPADPLIAATPSIPAAGAGARRRSQRTAKPAETKTAVARLPSRQRQSPSSYRRRPLRRRRTGLLDDGQIAGLKGRLRLTSDQVEYWPAVEAALRDVVRKQLRGTKHVVGGKVNIDTNSPEVQKLIWAAMPLLMRLRDDQKSEVRKLARVIGLEQVAAQI